LRGVDDTKTGTQLRAPSFRFILPKGEGETRASRDRTEAGYDPDH
jgi:hypothetical protein